MKNSGHVMLPVQGNRANMPLRGCAVREEIFLTQTGHFFVACLYSSDLHRNDSDVRPAFPAKTHSPYMDNRPLVTASKPETRKYKPVFFLGKSEIGLESDVVLATARP